MPAKGKRVASRQAQLNRRRRRQGRVAAEGGAMVSSAGEGNALTTTIAAPSAVAVRSASATGGRESETYPAAASSTPASVTRAQGQTRPDRSMAYTHLGAELRRILILAGILTVILIVVSFVAPPLI